MKFTEAAGHKVVSMATAETVGRVDDFVIDPRTHTIVALSLKKTDSGDTLHWGDISAFGADAITVSGADKVRPAAPDVAALSGKDHHVLGKRALSTAGDEIGKVADVDFDPESGRVLGLLVEGVGGSGGLEGEQLVGIGSYAVVVKLT